MEVLYSNNFGKIKTNKILKYITDIPCNIFIKYQGKKYILDVVGTNPQNLIISLDRPNEFINKYGDFDIPEKDWI